MSRERRSRASGARPLALGAAILLLVAFGAALWQRVGDLHAARSRERLLERRMAEANARIEELRARIERLREDPLTLERQARAELGMVKPGEVVIVFPK